MIEQKIKVVPENIDLYGKKVMVRVDFNIAFDSLNDYDYSGDYRIQKTIPLIYFLIKKGAKIIIICHYGRPEGVYESKFSIKPIVEYFSHLIGLKWKPIDNRVDIQRLLAVGDREIDEFYNLVNPIYLLKPEFSSVNKKENFDNGNIIFLENLRFDRREEENDEGLAEFLSRLCDIYINEAFSTSHRFHASISAIKRLKKEFYYGFLYKNEVDNLLDFLERPVRPLVLIMGGSKTETKLKLIKKFLSLADHILVGGVMANTILFSKGIAVGNSMVDTNVISESRDLLRDFDITSTKVHLPVDVVCANNLQSVEREKVIIFPVGNIPKNYIIGDLGPDTIDLFTKVISNAGTVIWNGNLGYTESIFFREASTKIAYAIVKNSRCKSLVGGGDTDSFLREIKLADKFTFISTGGGAMLEFLIEPRKFYY